MSGNFQGFGKALFKSFLVPLVLVVLSMGIMGKMGLMKTDVSYADYAPSEVGMSEQTKLYLLRIPGMRWLLLEDGGVPTERIVVQDTSAGLAKSVRPHLRPTLTAMPTE